MIDGGVESLDVYWSVINVEIIKTLRASEIISDPFFGTDTTPYVYRYILHIS